MRSSVDAPSAQKYEYVIVLADGAERPGAMTAWRQGNIVGLIYTTAPERPVESYLTSQIAKIDAWPRTPAPIPTRTRTATPTAAPARLPTSSGIRRLKPSLRERGPASHDSATT